MFQIWMKSFFDQLAMLMPFSISTKLSRGSREMVISTVEQQIKAEVEKIRQERSYELDDRFTVMGLAAANARSEQDLAFSPGQDPIIKTDVNRYRVTVSPSPHQMAKVRAVIEIREAEAHMKNIAANLNLPAADHVDTVHEYHDIIKQYLVDEYGCVISCNFKDKEFKLGRLLMRQKLEDRLDFKTSIEPLRIQHKQTHGAMKKVVDEICNKSINAFIARKKDFRKFETTLKNA